MRVRTDPKTMLSYVELEPADRTAFARVADAMMAQERIDGTECQKVGDKALSDYLKEYSIGHPMIVRAKKAKERSTPLFDAAEKKPEKKPAGKNPRAEL